MLDFSQFADLRLQQLLHLDRLDEPGAGDAQGVQSDIVLIELRQKRRPQARCLPKAQQQQNQGRQYRRERAAHDAIEQGSVETPRAAH